MKSHPLAIVALTLWAIPTLGLAEDPPFDEASSAHLGGHLEGGISDDGETAPPAGASEASGPDIAEPAPSEETTVPENTVARCGDGRDNDGDGHRDCDDQDCEIFAICVLPKETAPPPKEDALESPSPIRRPFSIGIFPGVGTDGGARGTVLNHFTLNFIGMGDMLRGAELSLLGAVRRDDVLGYQSAGLFNVNLGATRGYQTAGLVNISRRGMMGVQGAGLTNLTMGPLTGFQASGIFNLTREMSGFQGAGIADVALGSLTGFQGSGIAGVALGDVKGFQGAGIATVSRSATGFQSAGISSVALGDVKGFQGAGIASVAKGDVRGLQAAGIANVSTGEVTGAQIGLINYGTRVRGAQIGLINIAAKEMKGATVGMINYAGDGVFAPTFWMSDGSLLNLGMKMGSRHVYGLFGCGAHPIQERRLSWIVGIGGHLELGSGFWMELDLLHNALRREDRPWNDYEIDSLEQARLNAGYRFGDQFSVYLGPSLNLLISEARDEAGVIPDVFSRDHDDTRVALSFGMTAGIQWEPRFGGVNAWQ